MILKIRQAIKRAMTMDAPIKETKMIIELDCEAETISLSLEMHYLRLGKVKKNEYG